MISISILRSPAFTELNSQNVEVASTGQEFTLCSGNSLPKKITVNQSKMSLFETDSSNCPFKTFFFFFHLGKGPLSQDHKSLNLEKDTLISTVYYAVLFQGSHLTLCTNLLYRTILNHTSCLILLRSHY